MAILLDPTIGLVTHPHMHYHLRIWYASWIDLCTNGSFLRSKNIGSMCPPLPPPRGDVIILTGIWTTSSHHIHHHHHHHRISRMSFNKVKDPTNNKSIALLQELIDASRPTDRLIWLSIDGTPHVITLYPDSTMIGCARCSHVYQMHTYFSKHRSSCVNASNALYQHKLEWWLPCQEDLQEKTFPSNTIHLPTNNKAKTRNKLGILSKDKKLTEKLQRRVISQERCKPILEVQSCEGDILIPVKSKIMALCPQCAQPCLWSALYTSHSKCCEYRDKHPLLALPINRKIISWDEPFPCFTFDKKNKILTSQDTKQPGRVHELDTNEKEKENSDPLIRPLPNKSCPLPRLMKKVTTAKKNASNARIHPKRLLQNINVTTDSMVNEDRRTRRSTRLSNRLCPWFHATYDRTSS